MTDAFKADFAECMRSRGIVVESVDAEVTRNGNLHLRGYSSSDEDEGYSGVECELLSSGGMVSNPVDRTLHVAYG